MKRAAAMTLTIDVLVDSEHWKRSAGARAIARRALAQAAVFVSARRSEVAIILTDDAKIRRLNRDWRGVNAATNVLSFSATSAGVDHLGDIVLAYETVVREARREHKPLAHHLAHLVVHGYLHLLGYDHENEADAREMEQTERDILRRLSIPDPYQVCAPAAARDANRDGKRPRRRRNKTRTATRACAAQSA
jgi:probable rRNA maturation factor